MSFPFLCVLLFHISQQTQLYHPTTLAAALLSSTTLVTAAAQKKNKNKKRADQHRDPHPPFGTCSFLKCLLHISPAPGNELVLGAPRQDERRPSFQHVHSAFSQIQQQRAVSPTGTLVQSNWSYAMSGAMETKITAALKL